MKTAALFTFAFASLLALAACSTAPKSEAGRAKLERSAQDALTQALENDASLKPVIDKAVGYAIFPSIGKGAIGVGGAYGKGELFESGRSVGYCDLTQGSIGFQLGGQAYTEILVFQSREALDTFKEGKFRFDAQATAVALKSGAGANAKFARGVAVFTMDEAGLMYEASIGGQKFGYLPR